jgi:hypothetical protein
MTPYHSIFITFGERNAIMTNWLEFCRFCETSCRYPILHAGHLTPQDLRRTRAMIAVRVKSPETDGKPW